MLEQPEVKMKFRLTLIVLLWALGGQLFGKTTGELLGYSADQKLLIVNADDFGMCHAENLATIDLLKNHHITSATVMLNCPWVEEAAEFCRTNPGVDVGVHLTFTNEWKRYKWASVASSSSVPSLLDKLGFLHQTVLQVEQNAVAHEVEIEIRAQLEKAKKNGHRAQSY